VVLPVNKCVGWVIRKRVRLLPISKQEGGTGR